MAGNHSLVEDNLVEGRGGCGLSFQGTGIAYRGNMLRNNTGGAVCGSATDAGGNIP